MAIDAVEELTQAKTRLTTARAEREELKLAQQRGMLIAIDTVAEQWAENAGNVRKKLLALEAKLPGMLQGKGIAEMSRIIHEEIYQALNELAGSYQPGK